LIPKNLASYFAKPYVAGENSETALNKVKKINELGFSATLDILGENVIDENLTKKITSQYCRLYDLINENKIDCNVSIKATHIGLAIGEKHCLFNLSTLLKKAKEVNNFLRLDMENSKHTDQIIELYKYGKKYHKKTGIAIQSYLRRSIHDINDLASENFNARLCKGIYKESKKLSFRNSSKIKNNFLILAEIMALKNAYACYATHDQNLIDDILRLINKHHLSRDKFEFQVLYGVPMEGRLESLIEMGHKVRVYVPYGPDWFDYSIRRLKENPNIINFVLKNFFTKKTKLNKNLTFH
tara:strand:+ start:112759 stop:113652 length:894 start_codon:yes stop_codon:yes gene_type:complete